MNGKDSVFNTIGSLFNKAGVENEPWRFLFFLLILLGGLALLEIFFRYARRRIQTTMAEKEKPAPEWDFGALLPSLRLAFAALLLRVAESLLVISGQLVELLRGIEGILLALAAILLLFYVINLVDRLRALLPESLQAEFPENLFEKVKSILRVSILIGVLVVFVYSQKTIFPEWLWAHPWWRYLMLLVIIAVVYLSIRFIGRTLTLMVLALKESAENERLRMIIQSTIWPLRLLLSTIAIYAASALLELPSIAGRMTEITISILGTLAIVVFLYRLIEVLVYELGKFAQREDNLLDKSLAQMIRLVARVIVILFGAIYLIQTISGKPLSALLAGLGIGGLAIALAAQDTLKNFFGSIMIMLDRPFKIGQRVTVDGYDGAVEEIGFRSTRVRTLTGHLVTIPNEKMAASNIENIGQRPSIRRLANITITYDTPPDKVEKALDIVKGILDNHEGMHPDFPPRVFFNEFNDTSLNLLMLYWYHPPDYWKFLEFTQNVNLKIMRAFEAEGIEFAFPTTTTYLAQDDRRPLNINVSGEIHKRTGMEKTV